MYNRVVLIGRLATDPELRYIPSGQPVARFRIAVDRPVRRNGENGNGTDFFTVVAWRALAEQVGKHLIRGRLVLVEGRIQTRDYKDRDGVRRHIVEIVAQRVKFLDRPKAAEPAEPTEPVEAAEELEDREIDLGEEFDDVPF